uniref:Uncharacterized protein n=1 Tax=Oryza meridionalis TaxID=40149 RepID=A0A0E0DF16_9ORYZ
MFGCFGRPYSGLVFVVPLICLLRIDGLFTDNFGRSTEVWEVEKEENLKTMSCLYTWLGLTVMEGNSGWFTASTYPCVSRQNPPYCWYTLPPLPLVLFSQLPVYSCMAGWFAHSSSARPDAPSRAAATFRMPSPSIT